MAYGQINTSSGRSLTLTPDLGWVNGQGQQMVPNSGGMSLADLGNGGVSLDYSSPIEIGGVGKGYRIKGDPFTAVLDDGRRVQIGVDSEASRKATLGNLEVEKARLNNQLTLAQLAAAGRKEAPTFQHVETSDGMMIFNPRTGEFGPAQSANGLPIQGKQQPLTEFQGKSTGFGMRAQNSSNIIDSVGEGGNVKPSLFKQGVEGIPLIGGGLATLVNSLPESLGGPSARQQQVEQAQRDFTNSVLRQESGAAISAGEFDNARKQYFPQPGDSPEVIAQKRANRQMAIDGFKISAGPGAKNFSAPKPPSGAVAQALGEAKAAIAAGAPRDAVLKRLQQLGVTDTGGL